MNERLIQKNGSALDKFYYVEEEMLALVVMISDEEIVEDVEFIHVTETIFKKYN